MMTLGIFYNVYLKCLKLQSLLFTLLITFLYLGFYKCSIQMNSHLLSAHYSGIPWSNNKE